MSLGEIHFLLQRISRYSQRRYIVNSKTGRPSLSGELPPDLQNADLSLSHGTGYGLALIADCWCRVDIQEPWESPFKVREKFCTVEEEELLQHNMGDLPELQHLTLI